MSINENIIELAEGIASAIKEQGACVQLYGSWNKDVTEEERAQLSAKLREKGIETIKLYDYAELYIMADLDSEKKEQVVEVYKESTPMAFEEAAATFFHRRREWEKLETFINMMIAAAKDATREMMADFEDDDEEDYDYDYDYDDDDDEEYDEE